MKVAEMRRFYRLMPREFWLGMLTLVSVITLDVLPALIIGVVTSILMLVYRASRPHLSVLGALPDAPGAYADVARHPDAVPVPGILIVRPDAPLFYANAQTVQDGIRALVAQAHPPVRTALLDLDANDELDITSIEALTKIAAALDGSRVRLGIVHLHGPARNLAHRAGLLEHVTAEQIHPNMATAIAWAQSTPSRA
jgi:MFS superfamily sulfate permease-like transporter